MTGRLLFILALGFVSIGATAADGSPASQPAVLTADQVRAILRDRVEVAGRGVGIVVGLVDASGTRTIAYGKPARNSPGSVDGDTVYEIGSVTKVFTALLLADMVERGEVRFDDPISKYLPASIKTPKADGREITLLQLARHTSGLPRLPSNLAPKDPDNPYADYSVDQMYQFIAAYEPRQPFGTGFDYSNLGMGLLGHILSLRARTDYESLVRARILEPLGMKSTGIALTAPMREHLASGHSTAGNAVKNWDLPTLAGAGALRSTANDLCRFVSASLGITASRLSASMAKTQQKLSSDPDRSELPVGLGWLLSSSGGKRLALHSGATAGYYSFVGLDLDRRQGVVVLSNSADSIDDIGLHLLDPSAPLRMPAARTR